MSRLKDKAEREVRFIDRQRPGHGESSLCPAGGIAFAVGREIGGMCNTPAKVGAECERESGGFRHWS